MARDTGNSEQQNATEERQEFLEWTGSPLTGREAASFEERVISGQDMKRAYNVDLPNGVSELRWNAGNRHRIPTADLSPEIVRMLTQSEAGFRVTAKP